MAKDLGRSAYLRAISTDPGKVQFMDPKVLKAGAAYASSTGRPFYNVAQWVGAPKKGSNKPLSGR
jgi:hypothetical protein